MARLDWYIRANLKLRHMQLLVALDDMRHVGRTAGVLVEKPGFGRLADFAPVAFTGPGVAGDILSMTITTSNGRQLSASPALRPTDLAAA